MTEVTIASIRAFDAEQWLSTHEVPDYVLEYLSEARERAENDERYRKMAYHKVYGKGPPVPKHVKEHAGLVPSFPKGLDLSALEKP